MAQNYRQLLGTDLFSDSFGYLNGSDEALRTNHAGATAPTSTTAGMFWLDTTNNILKQRNSTNTDWVNVLLFGVANGGMLPTSGGTMSGDIAMGGQKVTGLGVASAANDAVRKAEHDLKAPIAAPAFTGDATVNQDPAGNDSLVRRSWATAQFLNVSGDTMTGNLSLAGNASSALHAVPLQQLAPFVTFNTSTGHRHDGTDARKIRGGDLDSGAEAAGKLLETTGAGGFVYKTRNQPLTFNYPAAYIWNSATTNNTWNSIDVSAAVTADAYAADILVTIDVAASFGHDYRFRANGLSHDTTQMAHTFQEGIGTTAFRVNVELSAAKIFQFNLRVSSGSPVVKIALMGYYRQAAS